MQKARTGRRQTIQAEGKGYRMRRIMSLWRTAVTIFTIAAIVHAYRTRQSHGRYYNIPFEFRIPTIERVKKRMWNPSDRRLFTPNIFGVGWTLNFHEAARRLNLIEEPADRRV